MAAVPSRRHLNNNASHWICFVQFVRLVERAVRTWPIRSGGRAGVSRYFRLFNVFQGLFARRFFFPFLDRVQFDLLLNQKPI